MLRIITFLAKIIVSVSLLIYCFSIVDITELTQSIGQFNYNWFLLAVIINILGTIVIKSVLVWKITGSSSLQKLYKIISINFAVRFYSLVFPKGVASAIRVVRYKHLTNDYSGAIALFAFESIVFLLVTSLGAMLFLSISTIVSVPSAISMVLLAAICILFILISMFLSQTVLKLAISSTSTLEKIPYLGIVPKVFNKLFIRIRDFTFFKLRHVIVTAVTSVFAYLLFLVNSVVLLWAIGLEIEFSVIAWIRSAVMLILNIPISVAGLGLREASIVTFFSYYDVPAATAFGYSMLVFLMFIVTALIGGIIELVNYFKNLNN